MTYAQQLMKYLNDRRIYSFCIDAQGRLLIPEDSCRKILSILDPKNASA